jgi:hypothetical protein
MRGQVRSGDDEAAYEQIEKAAGVAGKTFDAGRMQGYNWRLYSATGMPAPKLTAHRSAFLPGPYRI